MNAAQPANLERWGEIEVVPPYDENIDGKLTSCQAKSLSILREGYM